MPALPVLAKGYGEQLNRSGYVWSRSSLDGRCGMQGCYELMVNGEWRRTWADEAEAGIMAWTGVRV